MLLFHLQAVLAGEIVTFEIGSFWKRCFAFCLIADGAEMKLVSAPAS